MLKTIIISNFDVDLSASSGLGEEIRKLQKDGKCDIVRFNEIDVGLSAVMQRDDVNDDTEILLLVENVPFLLNVTRGTSRK